MKSTTGLANRSDVQKRALYTSGNALLVRVSYNFARHNQSVARKASTPSFALKRGISEPAGDSLLIALSFVQPRTIFHESLHSLTGLGDVALAQKLRLKQTTSAAISQALKDHGCK
jgi:hypothetical protein